MRSHFINCRVCVCVCVVCVISTFSLQRILPLYAYRGTKRKSKISGRFHTNFSRYNLLISDRAASKLAWADGRGWCARMRAPYGPATS